MEMKVIKCPNCGANAKNHTNCEYCGSLLVRFVDKGIEIKDTSYIDNSMVFPGLLEELKKNIKLQEKESNEEVWTEISWINKRGDEDYLMISSKESDYDSDEKEIDSSSNKDMLLTPQLVIQMCFSNWKGDDESTFYHNKEQDEQLMRFTQLKSFPLFTYKEYERDKDDDIYLRNFDINFGQDANGASRLISEILVKVKGLALSDSYGIYTGIGEESYAEEYKEYRRKKGLPVVEFEPTDENSDNINNESDYSEDQEENSIESLSNWQKVLLVLSSLFVVVGSYYYVTDFNIGRGGINLVLFLLILGAVFSITLALLPSKHYPAIIETGLLYKDVFDENPYSEAFKEDVASYKKIVTIAGLIFSCIIFIFSSPILTFSDDNQKQEQVETVGSQSSENQLTDKQSMKDELAAFAGNYLFSCYIGDTNAKMFFELSLKSDGTFSFKPGNESTRELMDIGKVIDGLDYPDGGKWKVEDSPDGRYALLEFDCSWGEGTISPDKSVIQINNMNGTTLKTQLTR